MGAEILGISTLDVYTGLGDALKTMGHDVFPYELHDSLKFYQEAVKHFIEGTNIRIPINQIYSKACEGLIATVVHHWPDLIIYITGQYIPPWVPSLIRERFKGMKQAVWYTESPYMIAQEIQRAPLYDYVFTCDKVCLPIYKRFNPNTFYLPTAYNSRYEWDLPMQKWEEIVYSPDVFFVGSEVPGRLEFLKEFAGYIKGEVDFKIFGTFPSIEGGVCAELEPFAVPTTLTKYEVSRYYRGAKLVLNHFRVNESQVILRNIKTGKSAVSEIVPYSLSPRVYEAFAAEACLLTQKRQEFDDLGLHDGEDLLFYENAKECAEKALKYIKKEHDQDRKRIAASAVKKMDWHTYLDRAEHILEVVEEVPPL